MQAPEQKIAGSITGEHSACSVCPVGGRRQTKDKDSGLVIAKTRDWPAPIPPLAKGSSFFFCYGSAKGAQFGTLPARRYRFLKDG
jgi:hypothetical protein